MKISIFGLGYVGSVSAACFGLMGHEVIGVDIKKDKVDSINSGIAPIYESGLNDILGPLVFSRKVKATTDVKLAIDASDISLICVGTPSNADNSVNTKFVLSICEEIGKYVSLKEEFHTIVIRSTIPPGTIHDILIPHIENKFGIICGDDFGFAMNPEFLREGSAIKDFFNPGRIIIGSSDKRTYEVVSSIYNSSSEHVVDSPVFNVPVKLAEMCKYVDNTFHALKVAFSNEIGVIAKEYGIDSSLLMDIFCKDRKLNLSPYYLAPGFSYGGSCLPKDLAGLVNFSRELGLETPIINSIEKSNKIHTHRAVQLIKNSGLTKIAILGLSFKKGTDDIRKNPIFEVISELTKSSKYVVKVYDPIIDLSSLKFDEGITVINNLERDIKNVEIVVLPNKSEKCREAALSSGKIILDLNMSISNETELIWSLV